MFFTLGAFPSRYDVGGEPRTVIKLTRSTVRLLLVI